MIPLRDNISSKKIPIVNLLLILGNCAVFYHQLQIYSSGELEKFIFRYAVIPKQFLLSPLSHVLQLFSSQFLHGGWLHLIGNMLYLYIFGDNIEDRLGHLRYLIFYLLAGCGAALSEIYFHPSSWMPMIGASGAIAGVLGAYFLLYPRAKILTLLPIWIFIKIVEIPAFFFLGFWFVLQAFSGTASLEGSKAHGNGFGGIAWFAHAGGFIVGAMFVLLFGRARRKKRFT